jgi:uncharacterized membrane protein YdfJ with MMPL/SSD domain
VVVFLVFPAVVVAVVPLAAAGVTTLVDTKIITIARTEMVVAVAMDDCCSCFCYLDASYMCHFQT